MFSLILRLVIPTAMAISCCLGAQATLSSRTIALTGETAPGTSGSEFEYLYVQPTINDLGQVAFSALLSGPGVDSTNDVGLWSEGMGSLELLARSGELAPGADGLTYVRSRLGQPNFLFLNNMGDVAFHASLSDGHTGIWIQRDGVVSLAMRHGGIAPGTGGAMFQYGILRRSRFNDNGELVFQASLSGPSVDESNGEGIWSIANETSSLIVRTGDAVPGLDNTVYSGLSTPALNNTGQVVFTGFLSGPDVNSTNNLAAWLVDSNGLSMLVRKGGVAAGTNGAVFDSFRSDFLLSDSGRFTFLAGLMDGDTDDSNWEGIWSGNNSSLNLVARMGSLAPGAGNATFSGFYHPDINQHGQVFMRAVLAGDNVDGTNNEGIWAEDNDVLTMIARTGDIAPGAGTAVFRDFARVEMNESGQVAFRGGLSGEGIDSTNDGGFWATDTDGELHIVVRKGQLYDVDDDPYAEDLRMVIDFNILNQELYTGGNESSFNNDGQLAFSLFFADGSHGVFVASIFGRLLGDINDDNIVGIEDLDVLLANWGDNVGQLAITSGDLSGDGVVGQADLDIVLANWGQSAVLTGNIPEPGSVAILITVGMSVLRRRG